MQTKTTSSPKIALGWMKTMENIRFSISDHKTMQWWNYIMQFSPLRNLEAISIKIKHLFVFNSEL